MAELVHRPVWADTWLFILIVFAICGGALLSTSIGQQALVDERVRVIETFGGTVDDDRYEAMLDRPPWWVYFTSGSRILLTPAATVLAALACWGIARAERPGVTFAQALSIVVHASVVLLLGQVIATPLDYVRESLTSPLNLAAILPLMEEGTLPTRFFGTLDLFTLWWVGLIAAGLAALTSRRVKRYAVALTAVYLGFAAVIAVVIAAVGGA